jgi:hypothetical protein
VDKLHGDKAIKDIDLLYDGRHTDPGLARQRALRAA